MTQDDSTTDRVAPPQVNDFVDNYLLYLLARASHQVSRQFHDLVKRHGLTVPEWRVLACAGDKDRTIGELAEMTLYQQPSLTKVIDRMVDNGLVVRRRDSADGRRVLVSITGKGRVLAEGLQQAALRHEAAILESYGAPERDRLKQMLKELIARTLPS